MRIFISAIPILLLLQPHAVRGEPGDVALSKLLARVEALEKQGEKQRTVIDSQQDRILQLESIVNSLGSNAPKANVSHHRDKDIGLQKEILSFQEISKIGRQRQKLGTRLVADEQVAFHARYDRGELNLKSGQKIIFPTVTTNLGGSYHDFSGTFIAPQAGLYIFSTSILSSVLTHSEIHVQIMKNGVAIADAFGHGDTGRHDQGSVTIVTTLNTGDEVYVGVLDAVGYFWGASCTSFMGVLLY